MPQIADVYGRENFAIEEGSVAVTIPFERMDLNYSNTMTAWGGPDGDTSNDRKMKGGAENPNIGIKKMAIGAENPNIGAENPNIGAENPNIDEWKAVCRRKLKEKKKTKNTVDKVMKMIECFGYETVFGREDVMREIGGGPTTTSGLLTELLGMEIIVSVAGHGKGKYRFGYDTEE